MVVFWLCLRMVFVYVISVGLFVCVFGEFG